MKKSDAKFESEVTDFVVGLLQYAKINHAGNCLMMCKILKPYLEALYGGAYWIINCTVIQGKKRVNHYYLETLDNSIIDPTASQFKFPDGKTMPQVYFGDKPDHYIGPRLI